MVGHRGQRWSFSDMVLELVEGRGCVRAALDVQVPIPAPGHQSARHRLVGGEELLSEDRQLVDEVRDVPVLEQQGLRIGRVRTLVVLHGQ